MTNCSASGNRAFCGKLVEGDLHADDHLGALDCSDEGPWGRYARFAALRTAQANWCFRPIADLSGPCGEGLLRAGACDFTEDSPNSQSGHKGSLPFNGGRIDGIFACKFLNLFCRTTIPENFAKI